MDGSLSSSRYGDGGGTGGGGGSRSGGGYRHNHYGGGGGRRHHRGGGRGGGYHNRRHHPYRRDDHRSNRHGGGGGGRSRHSGNRFQSSQSTQSTKSVDPKEAMLRQLAAMISRVGDVQPPTTDDATMATDDGDGENENGNEEKKKGDSEKGKQHYIESLSKNISDLASVLCSESNAPLFLVFQKKEAGNSTNNDDPMSDAPVSTKSPQKIAEETVGPLVHLIVSCVTSLPYQTPVYVGLTMAINRDAQKTDYAGFASRCIDYAMHQISWDLDFLLSSSFSSSTTTTSTLDAARAITRIQNILRYLALLGRVNVVQSYNERTDMEMNDTTAIQNLSMAGLLKTMTLAAVKAAKNSEAGGSSNVIGCMLAQLVLTTIPYALDYLPEHFFVDHLLHPLEANVLSMDLYKSTFTPGKGPTALLLSQEQQDGDDAEDKDDDEDSEDDDDDDDNDEDGEGNAGGRCDTLQDLLHSVKAMLQDKTGQGSTKFFLLQTLPWDELLLLPKKASEEEITNTEETDGGIDPMATDAPTTTTSQEPIQLELDQDCVWVQSLLLENSDFDTSSSKSYCTLSGVVYGRLPVFGTHEEDDDDDDDDEEGDEEEKSAPNERLVAYQKNFTDLDRHLLADAVRSCLLHHKSHVSDTGLERGSAKDAANTIWAVGKLFGTAPNQASPPVGVEYGIVETILGLIVQATTTGALRHIYLSRVLLELSRLEPSLLPQALVAGLSTLVQDYLPSLVPSARDNIGKWFAFHLANTDYQWPSAYWNHWASYVDRLQPHGGSQGAKQRNSRGEFVLFALRTMMSTNAGINFIYDCLPKESSLCNHLVVSTGNSSDDVDDNALSTTTKEVEQRIWDLNEDTDTVGEYMVSEDIATNLGEEDQEAPRTKLLIRAILAPAEKHRQELIQSLKAMKSEGEGDDFMMDVSYQPSKDLITILTDALVQYKPALMVALEFDARTLEKRSNGNNEGADEAGGSSPNHDNYNLSCEVYLLQTLQDTLLQSNIVLSSCVSCLLKNQVVGSPAVLHWVLGDFGGDPASPIILERWWDVAALTIPGASANSGFSDGLQSMLDTISPCLRYVVTRVCSLIASSTLTTSKGKLSPVEVDLLEGTKEFISTAYTRLTVIARRDNPILSLEEMRIKLMDAGVDNTKLSALCKDSYSGDQPKATEVIGMLAGILDSIVL